MVVDALPRAKAVLLRQEGIDMRKDICPHCKGSLIKIDHHGERLIGCILCNRWRPVDTPHARMFMQLPDHDLQALSNLSNARHKAEDTTP